MADICLCGSIALGNSGTPGCQPIEGVASRIIGVPLQQEDGTLNRIELATYTGSQAQWDGFLNAAPDARFYLTPAMGNVTDVRADSVFQTNDSGKSIFLRKGIRTANFLWDKQGGVFLEKLKEWRCTEFGIYIIDNANNYIGNISDDGLYLDPIPVDNDTWDVNLIKAVDGTSVQAVSVQFEFDRFTDDSKLRMIEASQTEINLLARTFRGLIDATQTVTNLTTAGYTVTVKMDYGAAGSQLPVKGLVVGDFSATEVTPTPGSIALNTATESADGVYDIDFSVAETGGDNIDFGISKNGYDIASVNETI